LVDQEIQNTRSNGMSQTEEDFKKVQEYIQKAPNQQQGGDDNEKKLKFYALFKQATDGPVQGKRPGVFDIVAVS
jgi:diazepam-binding inhibitor (GABA receptor modulating acyl-CoA-binding protein)